MIQIRNNVMVIFYAIIFAITCCGAVQAHDTSNVVVAKPELDAQINELSSRLAERLKVLGLSHLVAEKQSKILNVCKIIVFSALIGVTMGVLCGNVISHLNKEAIDARYAEIIDRWALDKDNCFALGTFGGGVDGLVFGLVMGIVLAFCSQVSSLPIVDAKKILYGLLTAAPAVPGGALLLGSIMTTYENGFDLGNFNSEFMIVCMQSVQYYSASAVLAALCVQTLRNRLGRGAQQKEIAKLIQDIAACKTPEECQALTEKIVKFA